MFLSFLGAAVQRLCITVYCLGGGAGPGLADIIIVVLLVHLLALKGWDRLKWFKYVYGSGFFKCLMAILPKYNA